MCPTENNLRAFCYFPHLHNISADAISPLIDFSKYLLPTREDRLRAPYIYINIPALYLRDRPRNQIAFTLLELLVYIRTLRLSYSLQYNLLRYLRCYPAQPLSFDTLRKKIPNLNIRIFFSRFIQKNFTLRVLNNPDDFFRCLDVNFTGLFIK